jgi:hypothetical protein
LNNTSDSPPAVTYCPPSHDVLEHFAFAACQELGSDFDNPEVARGFADFLATVAQIHANNLNRKGNNDLSPRIE